MGRERYLKRTRYLYALRFPGRQCYIGQTCDPHRRFLEHRRAWPEPFEPLVLGSVDATRAEAEDYEKCYRVLAHRAGWTIRFDPAQPWATLKHPEGTRLPGVRLPWALWFYPARLVVWFGWLVVLAGLWLFKSL